ncbi:hypothetical protein CLK_A0130 (plasmid) [Clostridium botulinum A3 str. Loch Maree]|nr:hypothetical protein [Clostridium botulinum]ACA57521.1 hypothetical protein CLK_A0130 [Clostridium botulinum A3 str. Loch Maree]
MEIVDKNHEGHPKSFVTIMSNEVLKNDNKYIRQIETISSWKVKRSELI